MQIVQKYLRGETTSIDHEKTHILWWKKTPTEMTNNWQFLNGKGEDIVKGHLTLLENFLLSFYNPQITNYSCNILQVYQAIYKVCQLCDSVNFPLFLRTENALVIIFYHPYLSYQYY